MREMWSNAIRAVGTVGTARGARPVAILFAWIAIFLIGARTAFLSSLARFSTDGLPPPLLVARATLYQAQELLIAAVLCVTTWALLRSVEGNRASRIVLAFASGLAVAIVILNLVSAATLPILGSPLTAGMIVYSDLLFSHHGRIAVASWVPPELLVTLATCTVAAALATLALVASRIATGLAILGSLALVLVAAAFLVTDHDRDSSRKSSASLAFVRSVQVFNTAAVAGDAPEIDPFAGNDSEPPVPLDPGARERIDSVIFVVLESAGAGYFDQYGGRYGISPELTRLAPQSLRAERAYANTASSFLAMMTMLSARQIEVSPNPSRPRAELLPRIARDAGLRTAFFHSSDTRSAGADRFLASAGFELVRDYRSRPCDAPLIADQSEFHSQGTLDRCTFDEMKRWISAQRDGPFFGMLWSFQSHFDYFPGRDGPLPALRPGEFANDPLRANNKRRYLAALREADEQIGLLADFLEAQGLAERTLVIVTGDHGESFNDHGQFGHGGSLYESAVHVPLILINPRLSPQRTFARPVSHLDLAPTIADLLGQPIPPEWDGHSLFGPRPAIPVIFSTPYVSIQVGYRTGNRKVIGHLLENRIEAYDLAADPGEMQDLAAGNRQMEQEELTRIRGWVRYLNTRDRE